LLYSIQTGESAFEKQHGKPIFDYFSETGHGKIFDQAMTGVHVEKPTMLEAYEFTGIKTLATLARQRVLIAAILKKYPAMHGILYDLPAVVERARTSIQLLAWMSAANCGRNFFETVRRVRTLLHAPHHS